MVKVNSKLYDKLWEIADNLHPTHRPNKDFGFPHYGSVTERVAVRRLHCSGTKGKPIRYKSCYAFLAGTESVPVGGTESVTDNTEQCRR